MADQSLRDVFSDEKLTALFSPDRSDQFFDALYGDASDGVRMIFLWHSKVSAIILFDLSFSLISGLASALSVA